MHQDTHDILAAFFVALVITALIILSLMSYDNSRQNDICQELVEPYASRIVDDKCYRLDENGNLILLSEKYEKN
jgi:hypothetical protein